MNPAISTSDIALSTRTEGEARLAVSVSRLRFRIARRRCLGYQSVEVPISELLTLLDAVGKSA